MQELVEKMTKGDFFSTCESWINASIPTRKTHRGEEERFQNEKKLSYQKVGQDFSLDSIRA